MIPIKEYYDRSRLNVKINDLYPAFTGKTYTAEDLQPIPEVVYELNRMLIDRLKQENVEIENWLRRTSIPLVEEGYRIDELTLILRADRFWRKDMPLRVLMPAKEIHPAKLLIRRMWRKVFPYRLPNGSTYNKVAKQVVTLS